MTWLEAILRGSVTLDRLGREGEKRCCDEGHGEDREQQHYEATGGWVTTVALGVALVVFVTVFVVGLVYRFGG
jgi:hypothetical protein